MKKFEQLGRGLSKDEQKTIMGGVMDDGGGEGGTCCAHTVDWSYWSVCGLSRSQAQQAASQYVQQNGGHAFWCCDSCP